MTKSLKILLSAIVILGLSSSCSVFKKQGEKQTSVKDAIKNNSKSSSDDDKPASKKAKKKNIKHKGSEIK